MGFYLSEHTTTITNEKNKSNVVRLPRPQMSDEEIYDTLAHAIIKNIPISIQLNERPFDSSNFTDDLIGRIRGYSEDMLFLDHSSLPIHLIRHITLL